MVIEEDVGKTEVDMDKFYDALGRIFNLCCRAHQCAALVYHKESNYVNGKLPEI